MNTDLALVLGASKIRLHSNEKFLLQVGMQQYSKYSR